jgi:hypothetical protein
MKILSLALLLAACAFSVPAQTFSAVPPSVNFGNVNDGSPSLAMTITLTNQLTTPVTVSAITIINNATGASSTDITSQSSSTCKVGSSVPVKGTCTLVIVWIPAVNSVNVAMSETITVSGAPNAPTGLKAVEIGQLIITIGPKKSNSKGVHTS